MSIEPIERASVRISTDHPSGALASDSSTVERPIDAGQAHGFALRFRDAALERAFWARHDRSALQLVRIAWLLAIALYLVIGLMLLRTVTHGHAVIQLAYFGVGIPALLLALASTFLTRFDRWRQTIIFLTLAISVAVVNIPFLCSDPPQDWNHAANLLMVCFTFSFVAVRYPLAVLNAALICAFFAAQLFQRSDVDSTHVLYASTFFSAVLLVNAVAGFMLEQSLRRNFLQARELIELREIADRNRARSDHLLLNILPAEVAEELKSNGAAEARQFDSVSVLFTDFKGFTAISEQLSPKELVRDIHECFSAFDRICARHGIEKIKTIGDAYMAAGGLPTATATHAWDVLQAAFEMRDFIAAAKASRIAQGLPCFEIRIGIHTGPVVAGIVGVKKFAYDIWGDTVNIASRMESSGEVGRINVSEATFTRLNDEMRARDGKGAAILAFQPRGKVRAKGKGEIEMYFVDRDSESAGDCTGKPIS